MLGRMLALTPADRLTGPFILTVSGGVLILVAGIERSAQYFGSTSNIYYQSVVPLSFVLEANGVIVFLCGMMHIARPDLHQVWGAITVTAASFSLFSFSGVSSPSASTGIVLSLIGGVLGIVLRPDTRSKQVLEALSSSAEP